MSFGDLNLACASPQFCLGCFKIAMMEVTHFADFVFLEFAGIRIGEFQIHLGYVVAAMIDRPLCAVNLKLREVDIRKQ